MGRFASTVAYYEDARAPYGEAFFAAVARDLRLDGSQRLLDVATGPGLLAIGFARHCREAVGVDPEPAMLEAARAAAARAGVAVRFVEGRFEDEAAGLGGFDVVAIGRAIHWLDPEPALKALDRVVRPGGRILVCHASTVADGRNPWLKAFTQVRNLWKTERPAFDRDRFFAGGPFVPRRTVRVETTVTTSVERLADRILSMSTSSPARLGDDAPAMRNAMREALEPYAAGGAIEETVEAEAEVFERATAIE